MKLLRLAVEQALDDDNVERVCNIIENVADILDESMMDNFPLAVEYDNCYAYIFPITSESETVLELIAQMIASELSCDFDLELLDGELDEFLV